MTANHTLSSQLNAFVADTAFEMAFASFVAEMKLDAKKNRELANVKTYVEIFGERAMDRKKTRGTVKTAVLLQRYEATLDKRGENIKAKDTANQESLDLLTTAARVIKKLELEAGNIGVSMAHPYFAAQVNGTLDGISIINQASMKEAAADMDVQRKKTEQNLLVLATEIKKRAMRSAMSDNFAANAGIKQSISSMNNAIRPKHQPKLDTSILKA